MNYVLYVADTETTGLDAQLHDVIEISFYRMTDDVQKTWQLRPLNPASIDAGALRVNGHKLEDLLHQTATGRTIYREPSEVLVEVENWIAEDGVPSENRVLVGANVGFDKEMFLQLWKKCGQVETYPFGRRVIDVQALQFAMDWARGQMLEGYSLSNLNKKYGITNNKAHTAAADTLATKQVLDAQIAFLKKLYANI